MPIPPDDYLLERFRQENAEVHSFRVSSDRSVIVYDATHAAKQGKVRNVPVLFTMMCVSGGGPMVQRTIKQTFEGTLDPGCIGVAAPSAPGYGKWPEMRIVGFGIHVDALKDSFGSNWPNDLGADVLSKPVRDPMIEATMMQVGYTHAGHISDSVMLHAAHMVVHHLLDMPGEAVPDTEKSDAHPLPASIIEDVQTYVTDHIEQTISVEDLARHVAISRSHFSRRFRATTGQTPYQYILDLKLDHAATTLRVDQETKVIDAANMVGFRNPARFAEAFRRRFGQSPRKWRLGKM
ncbi:MAG: AraC family transcriptional regulator [Pseudomonadota bacterium]